MNYEILLRTYLGKIEETPGNDGVVVECHVERYDGAADADSGEERGDLIPHPDGSLPQPLPDGQFQVEHRDTLDCQHDEVGNEESS